MKIKHFKIRLDERYLYLDEERINNFLKDIKVLKTDSNFIDSDSPYWSLMLFYNKIEKQNTQKPFDPADLTPEQYNRYKALRIWRTDTANRQGVENFMIAHNRELGDIAVLNPSKIEDLYLVKGFKDKKVTKYGAEIISVLNSL